MQALSSVRECEVRDQVFAVTEGGLPQIVAQRWPVALSPAFATRWKQLTALAVRAPARLSRVQARSGLAVLAVLGAALLVAGWSVNSASRPAPDLEETEAPQPESLATTVSAAPNQGQLLAAHELSKSLMMVAYPVPGADWPDMAAVAPAAGQALRDTDPAAKKAEGKSVSLPDRAALAKLSASVFSDRQLTSIRDRLKLTQEQARYWPAVEEALRALTWHRQRGRPGVADGTLDPNGVRTLVSAAAPLVLTLREEQKREVRTLAHLIGLEQLASQI